MMQSAERGSRLRRASRQPPGMREALPYVIEIWNEAGTKVERVIARAQNASLARAIFRAACEEHPERRLTLRQNGRTLATSRE